MYWRPVRLSIYLSIHPSVYLSVFLFACLSIHLSTVCFGSFSLSMYLSACLYVCVIISPSIRSAADGEHAQSCCITLQDQNVHSDVLQLTFQVVMRSVTPWEPPQKLKAF